MAKTFPLPCARCAVDCGRSRIWVSQRDGSIAEHMPLAHTGVNGGAQGGTTSLHPAARNPAHTVALASWMAALIFSSMVRVVSVLQLSEQSVMRQTIRQSSST